MWNVKQLKQRSVAAAAANDPAVRPQVFPHMQLIMITIKSNKLITTAKTGQGGSKIIIHLYIRKQEKKLNDHTNIGVGVVRTSGCR